MRKRRRRADLVGPALVSTFIIVQERLIFLLTSAERQWPEEAELVDEISDETVVL